MKDTDRSDAAKKQGKQEPSEADRENLPKSSDGERLHQCIDIRLPVSRTVKE